ncbi:hypothetical protein ACGRSR_13580 [Vibrio owensii]|uniref:hypothetical protein n=1 Tax=Vibrio owensii TaxID=696485 RepID=UPI0021CF338D
MNDIKSKIKIYFASFSSTIIRLVQNAGVIIILSNLLSFESFSDYVFGITVFGVLSLFIDSGSYNKTLSLKEEDINDYILDSMVIRAMLYLFSIVVSLIYVINSGIDLIFTVAGVVTFLSSIVETYLVSLKVKRRFYFELTLTFLQMSLVFIFLYLYDLGYIDEYNAIVIPRIMIFSLLLLINIRQIVGGLQFISRFSNVTRYYKSQWEYNLDSIVSGFNLNIDQYLIVFYLGKEALTVYQSASKIYSAFISLAGAIGAIIIPNAVKENEITKKAKGIVIPFLLFSFAFALVHLIVAPTLSDLLFNLPIKLDESVFIMLSLIILTRYLNAGFGSTLMVLNMQYIRANANLLFNILIIVFSLISSLFMDFDMQDILMTVLFSQILILITYVYFVRRAINEKVY